MRKRILAIFLLPDPYTVPCRSGGRRGFHRALPPGNNFLPPNRPEQPEPDDEDRIVTLQIPITKVVELGKYCTEANDFQLLCISQRSVVWPL